jgi:signal peptidase I
MSWKSNAEKTWQFLWHSDSAWSWFANIIIAFIVIRFIFYPLLGAVMATGFPIVAVVSESMEHGLHQQTICGTTLSEFKESFDNYWDQCGEWYEEREISKQRFLDFPLKNGFDKGDIIIVFGRKPEKIEVGDVIIFEADKPQPIIHRVVKRWQEGGEYLFQTKGDHNQDVISGFLGEDEISTDRILGRGVLRIPYLGWIKIVFVEAVRPLGWTIN